MTERINDPRKISSKEIQKIISEGKSPIIQFSDNFYTPALLKKIDQLCKTFGGSLEVRFYGHYKTSFDATNLKYIPHVEKLSLDCLRYIENYNEIGNLDKLSSLSFGVYYFDDKEFLSKIKLSSLQHLCLGETHKKNINLSYLSECKNLEHLHIVGHIKNIQTVGDLQYLKKLTLGSIGKKQDLQFVNKLTSLEQLTLILGGRDSFCEVQNPELKKIEIIRVRGLSELGDLSRFKKLEYLHIEDQIKIQQIKFKSPLKSLSNLKVITCKNLSDIHEISMLPNLEQLRLATTNISSEELLSRDLPKKLDVFAIYTGKETQNKRIRKLLDERGYREYS